MQTVSVRAHSPCWGMGKRSPPAKPKGRNQESNVLQKLLWKEFALFFFFSQIEGVKSVESCWSLAPKSQHFPRFYVDQGELAEGQKHLCSSHWGQSTTPVLRLTGTAQEYKYLVFHPSVPSMSFGIDGVFQRGEVLDTISVQGRDWATYSKGNSCTVPGRGYPAHICTGVGVHCQHCFLSCSPNERRHMALEVQILPISLHLISA